MEKGNYYHDFPGLNHLYIRFDWSDVEKEPGVFDWAEIDAIMDEWGKEGYRFALRMCCSETLAIMRFATPEWLYKMGCKGAFYPPYYENDPQWWENVIMTHTEKMNFFLTLKNIAKNSGNRIITTRCF